MTNIVSNRIKIDLLNSSDISLSILPEKKLKEIEKQYLKRYKITNLLSIININKSNISIPRETKDWLNELKKENIEEEPFVNISFYNNYENLSKVKPIKINDILIIKNFLKAFIKETLIVFFKKNNNYIVEPYSIGCDFSIYEETNGEIKGFKRFTRYDFVIHVYKNYEKKVVIELAISVGSENTYIGWNNKIIRNIKNNYKKVKVVKEGFLIKTDIDKVETNENSDLSIKADFVIKKILRIKNSPKKNFYKEYYNSLQNFIKNNLSQKNEKLKIYNSFLPIKPKDKGYVDFDSNKMVFKLEELDYNAINGMRDYGPYSIPANVKDYKLLFIYPDSDSAKRLFQYFSRGYRHFPGLETYIGLPANVAGVKIKYDDFNDKFLKKIDGELPKNHYENFLAIVIMPFTKENADEEQIKYYYLVKEKLLQKNITSQFINRDKIFQDNFHFSLPNIAIAILAKIGGIPWRLQRKKYKQLIVGFNVYKENDATFLGSAVYFDNEGLIRSIQNYNDNSIQNVCSTLSDAINQYQSEHSNIESVVIHYYKALSMREKQKIETFLGNIELSFALVEINDSKVSTDLCFDLDYELYMPQSGLYVKLKPNEFLLFNNLRYWERPINPIRQEEYPLKLRIYNPANILTNKELITQVYEFSRLYWKSLKQKAQPVTTIYSKLVAEYVSHFQNELPESEKTKKTVWFI